MGALILAINLFTLLGAYYLLKTVRESLILAEGGAEVKAYSSAAQAAILLGVVPLYGATRTFRRDAGGDEQMSVLPDQPTKATECAVADSYR